MKTLYNKQFKHLRSLKNKHLFYYPKSGGWLWFSHLGLDQAGLDPDWSEVWVCSTLSPGLRPKEQQVPRTYFSEGQVNASGTAAQNTQAHLKRLDIPCQIYAYFIGQRMSLDWGQYPGRTQMGRGGTTQTERACTCAHVTLLLRGRSIGNLPQCGKFWTYPKAERMS